MIRIILLTLLLTGCVTSLGSIDLDTPRNDTIAFGDSWCDNSPYNLLHKTYPQVMGINRDCLTGRKMVDRKTIPGMPKNEYTNIIIQLGGNDAIYKTNTDKFRSNLISLLTYDDARYICVLPHVKDGTDTSLYRDIMIQECPEYVDPATLKLQYQLDNVHLTYEGGVTLANELLRKL